MRRTHGQYSVGSKNNKVLVVHSKNHAYPDNYDMTELQVNSATVNDFNSLLGTQTCVEIGD